MGSEIRGELATPRRFRNESGPVPSFSYLSAAVYIGCLIDADELKTTSRGRYKNPKKDRPNIRPIKNGIIIKCAFFVSLCGAKKKLRLADVLRV